MYSKYTINIVFLHTLLFCLLCYQWKLSLRCWTIYIFRSLSNPQNKVELVLDERQNNNPLDRWEGVRGQKEFSLCHRRKWKASTGSVWSCTWPWVLRNFMFLLHSSILLVYCGTQGMTCRKDIKIQFEDQYMYFMIGNNFEMILWDFLFCQRPTEVF